MHPDNGSRAAPMAHRRRAKALALPRDGADTLRLWLMGLAISTLAVLMLAMTPAHARGTPDGFADLADRLLPAVVNISTTQSLPQERGPELPQFPPGSPFDEFFKDFFDRHGGNNGNNGIQPMPRKATSLGSGFIIDPEGYIVTNNHVIQDADEITVILSDDSVLKAEIVGRDAKVDIALLKVTTKKELPYVKFGDSDAARVGDWVMAIGNPFGLGGTVTAGIISAKTRDINAGPYDSFIQTDASINRGNSGGPLFDMAGDVVGINTAIFSPTGGSVGIGFATPSNLVKQVLSDLRKYGKTRRGWLGVRIQSVTEEIADSLGLKKAQGALVASVMPDSPAAEADIRAGDIILEFDGRAVKEMRRLPAIVAEAEIDTKVPVIVWRNGERTSVTVVVAELLDDEEQAALPADTPAEEQKPEQQQTGIMELGLAVTPLTDSLREQFNMPADITGLLITDVKGDGPAAEKGLREGDVVVEVNQSAVTAPADVKDQITKARDAGRKSVLLLVQNGTGMRFVAVNMVEG